MSIKKHIPNTITSMNLFSGTLAMVMAFQGRYEMVAFFVFLAAFFDFFDGFVARLLHVSSPIGKELDSLADVVSFGVAPGLALYNLLSDNIFSNFGILKFIPYTALLIPVFSALRLARFNLDKRQTSSFIGLATPANALFWVSLIPTLQKFYPLSKITIIGLCSVVLLFCYLLNAELPMFAFKIKSFNFIENKKRYFFVLFSVILIVIFGLLGVSFAILLYIALALYDFLLSKRSE